MRTPVSRTSLKSETLVDQVYEVLPHGADFRFFKWIECCEQTSQVVGTLDSETLANHAWLSETGDPSGTERHTAPSAILVELLAQLSAVSALRLNTVEEEIPQGGVVARVSAFRATAMRVPITQDMKVVATIDTVSTKLMHVTGELVAGEQVWCSAKVTTLSGVV